MLLSPILMVVAYQARAQVILQEADGRDVDSISDSNLQSQLVLQDEIDIGHQIDDDDDDDDNSGTKLT